MDNNKIGDEGMRLLCKSAFPELHTLRLENNDIGDEGINQLFKSSFTPLLRLVISLGNDISDQAMKLIESWNANVSIG